MAGTWTVRLLDGPFAGREVELPADVRLIGYPNMLPPNQTGIGAGTFLIYSYRGGRPIGEDMPVFVYEKPVISPRTA